MWFYWFVEVCNCCIKIVNSWLGCSVTEMFNVFIIKPRDEHKYPTHVFVRYCEYYVWTIVKIANVT